MQILQCQIHNGALQTFINNPEDVVVRGADIADNWYCPGLLEQSQSPGTIPDFWVSKIEK